LEKQLASLAEHFMQPLSATGLLRSAPELVILDPTHRSRLRWLPEKHATILNEMMNNGTSEQIDRVT
jgi:hypothetical protein